jgi:hypothetical protein
VSAQPARLQFGKIIRGSTGRTAMGSTWTWRLESADGSELTEPPSPHHANQSDAESWLGEQWRELASAGVAQASLFDGDRKVYGPMSLAEG